MGDYLLGDDKEQEETSPEYQVANVLEILDKERTNPKDNPELFSHLKLVDNGKKLLFFNTELAREIEGREG